MVELAFGFKSTCIRLREILQSQEQYYEYQIQQILKQEYEFLTGQSGSPGRSG
jgi:hypothetical protein